jgi:hypothetical protein
MARSRIILLLLLPVLSVGSIAWHTPPHQQITRAAVDSLPPALQAKLGAEKETLIMVNCMYPDRYRALGNMNPERLPDPAPKWLAEISPRSAENWARIRAEMRPYCEMPDGRVIHNVTENRQEDVASLEYLLNAIIREIRRGDTVSAARYMGTLAHLLEDSTSPAHAGKLPLVVMELRKLQPIPSPPPWAGRLNEHGGKLGPGNLHAAIELTTLPFTLAERRPRSAGKTVAEAAPKLLDRCYAIVAENRADLLEMVRATFADDRPVMDRLRSRAARQAAELLADAYYTVLTLAAEEGG